MHSAAVESYLIVYGVIRTEYYQNCSTRGLDTCQEKLLGYRVLSMYGLGITRLFKARCLFVAKLIGESRMGCPEHHLNL
jgi:hypothetical protein